MIGGAFQAGWRRHSAVAAALCFAGIAVLACFPVAGACSSMADSEPLPESGVALIGSAVKRDRSSPGAFYYALAVNGVTTDGSVGASEDGRIAIRLEEEDEGVFVLHSSCDCVIEVQVLRFGEVVDSATATGPHTVARVRFGSSVAESSAE